MAFSDDLNKQARYNAFKNKVQRYKGYNAFKNLKISRK